jgi:tetratricopeptide (TPR) repeat protein
MPPVYITRAGALTMLVGAFLFPAFLFPFAPLQAETRLPLSMEEFEEKFHMPLDNFTNFAHFCEIRGEFGLAEFFYRKAIDTYKQDKDTNGTNIIDSLHNLAVLYQSRHRYPEAEGLYREALALSEQSLGESSDDTLNSIYGLAYVLEKQGRKEEAKSWQKRSWILQMQMNQTEINKDSR